MPLINGQKMACEPCIRGHRSTKCTHANERLMVPVRKPGRPLSSCPHPSSRPCSCAAVTAAIPRKQKCGCGTSTTTIAENKPEKKEPNAATSPPSPSKTGGSGFRIQKHGTKISSRKQSVDLASLHRMDANQLNILPPHSGVSSQQMNTPSDRSTPISDLSIYGSVGMSSGDSSFGGEAGIYPPFSYSFTPPSVMPPVTTEEGLHRQNGTLIDGSAKLGAEGRGSCCGGVSTLKSQTEVNGMPTAAAAAAVNGGSAPTTKTCCSSRPSSTQDNIAAAEVMPPPSMPFPNGVVMQSFQPPIALHNAIYPFYAQPSIFNYPPQYGSYMQPLQPEQWRQVMAAMAFGQPTGSHAFGMPGAVGIPQNPAHNSTAFNIQSSWTTHQCSCGDSCQCVGCAAHPYNEATQNYVRSAWNTMVEDSQKTRPRTNGSGSHLNETSSRETSDVEAKEEDEESKPNTDKGTITPIPANGEGTWSPTAPQTPSDAASGMSEEQTLSASDFFFVSYPFGDTCAGDTSSCLCGDDCQCIGCTIHNNTDPAQADPAPV